MDTSKYKSSYSENSLWNKLAEFAKKAGKAAKKSTSAQNSANKTSTKALEANIKTCLEGMIWSEENQMCIDDVPEAVIIADAGKVASGGSDTGVNNAAEIAKQTQEAKDNALGDTSTRCKSIEKGGFGIFNYLACKITTVVADVRAIVYVLAGFGMIAFAYGAILGKVNFKQLANIGIGLFILSMTTSFIEYFVS